MEDRLIFICGDTTSGKSQSLSFIKDPTRCMYLACEGKGLPFRFPKELGKFKTLQVVEPKAQIPMAIEAAVADPTTDTIIIDTLDYALNMFQSIHVEGVDGYEGWNQYKTWIRDLFLQLIPKATGKNFLVLAHTKSKYNSEAQGFDIKIPVKGSVRDEGGLEGFSNCIVMAKKMPTDQLVKFPNKYLNITEEDIEDGYKYVFQTRPTKETINEPTRSIQGMFLRSELYIDNNAQHLTDALDELYSDED